MALKFFFGLVCAAAVGFSLSFAYEEGFAQGRLYEGRRGCTCTVNGVQVDAAPLSR